MVDLIALAAVDQETEMTYIRRERDWAERAAAAGRPVAPTRLLPMLPASVAAYVAKGLADGNGNGVLTSEIASGVDPSLGAYFPWGRNDVFPGIMTGTRVPDPGSPGHYLDRIDLVDLHQIVAKDQWFCHTFQVTSDE
jgi:hypothetical protein